MHRGAGALLAISALGGAHGLIVTPAQPVMDTPVNVELRVSKTLKPPVYVTARSSTASVRARLRWYAPKRWRTALTFTTPGTWTLRAAGATATVTVQPPPAATFVPPGAPGCTPPSPANAKTREMLGSNGLWALFDSLDVRAGAQTKIVWRFAGTGELTLYALGPSGERIDPSGVVPHGSSWLRPGDEWGSIFVFDAPGCWQIHAQRADVGGDLWLVVRS